MTEPPMPPFASHLAATRRSLALILAAGAWTTAPASAGALSDLPSTFKIEGRQTIASLQAVGAQIYACSTGASGARSWALREPIATLMQEGKTVGRHYAGPNWDTADGGVTGKLEASAPGATPDDIPQLQLQVVGRHGAGPLTDAQVVLRLHTVGGVLAGACERDGEFRAMPYRADYVFLK